MTFAATGGARLLTVWGEIKGPMAQYAGATFTTQLSLDVLAYLLQQNGLPAGSEPLTDTGELSDTIPGDPATLQAATWPEEQTDSPQCFLSWVE